MNRCFTRGRAWRGRGLFLTACVGLVLLSTHRVPLRGGDPGVPELLITEDFDDEATPGILLARRAGSLCGTAAPAGTNAACIDDVAGLNGGPGRGRLLLTEAFNDQTGYAWVETPVDLVHDQISVELDLFIFGGSNPPADGLSVIFQLGNDPGIVGRGGGALGTGGLPTGYVSVAFDVWDNGESDVEGPCDGISPRTCHVEVNWSSDPETQPSALSSNDVPNFTAAGEEDVPIRVRITLNEREISVVLSTSFDGYGTHEAIHALLPAAPGGAGDGMALLGFAAATGGANANHAIDNLSVTRAPIDPPIVEAEPAVERGGINCGGGALSAILAGAPIEIAADRPYGEIAQVIPGPPTTFVLRGHGRLATGDDHAALFAVPISLLSDPSLEPMYQSESWSQIGLRYRYDVIPGRYRVSVHMAENCPCGLDRNGWATRRYDVRVQGEDALRFFSPAEAASMTAGTCGASLSTAVTRSFEVDSKPYGAGAEVLEVVVDDLGGGAPPENAQLNGITFERLGDATGAPISGDIEDDVVHATSTFGPPAQALDLSFDGSPDGTLAAQALSGAATVSSGGPGPDFLHYRPAITGGRLRLADDSRQVSATSVVFDGGGNLVFDPLAVLLRAEFDVFFTNTPGRPPADGLVFGILAGQKPMVLGGAGGALGFAGLGTPAIGVEIDLWEGGGFGDDSGFNTDRQGHMAIVGSGGAPATVDHVQDQNDFDAKLDGPPGAEKSGWVDFLSPSGFHVEVFYSPEARVEVYLTALDGSFARRQVLGSFVTPFTRHQAMAGFFAGTGSETATMEIDNLRVKLSPCQDAPEKALILGGRRRSVAVDEGGSTTVQFDGSASSTGEGDAGRTLLYRWSVTGPLDGAVVERHCEPATPITFTLPGAYQVSLDVDDQHCSVGGGARDTVDVTVLPEGGTPFLRSDTNCDSNTDISDPVITLNVLFLGTGEICCDDAADTNDDGKIDISDAVATLNYLFLGGPAPQEPLSACGIDPSADDGLECADARQCR